jgi:hypothetical protein
MSGIFIVTLLHLIVLNVNFWRCCVFTHTNRQQQLQCGVDGAQFLIVWLFYLQQIPGQPPGLNCTVLIATGDLGYTECVEVEVEI